MFANALHDRLDPGGCELCHSWSRVCRRMPETDPQSGFSRFPPRLPGPLGLRCHSGGQCGIHSRSCGLTSANEAEKSTNVWRLMASLPQILEEHSISSRDFHFVLLLWKTGRPTSTTLGQADFPVMSQKSFSVAKQLDCIILELTFFFKSRFLKRHINLLFVYLWTDLQISFSDLFQVLTYEKKKKIQGKSCPRAVGYRWF